MRKFVSLSLAVILTVQLSVMSISSESFNTTDEQVIYNYSIPSSVQASANFYGYGDVIETKSLFDYYDNLVGYCFDFNNSYVICDTLGNVIEHSPENNSPYFNNSNERAYYGGALIYYTKVNDEFIDLRTSKSIDRYELEKTSAYLIRMNDQNNLNTFSQNKKNNNSLLSASGFNIETYYAEGTPRTFNFNTVPPGNCGTLATAIMLFYYYDYVCDNYVPSAYVNAPRAFYDYLTYSYFYNGSGDCNAIHEGIKSYFKKNNINDISVPVINNFDGYLTYKISKCSEPVILGLYGDDEVGESWRINHWVVAYGYREYFMDGQSYNKEYIVNDGWGHNQVFITYSTEYMDGVVGFSQ